MFTLKDLWEIKVQEEDTPGSFSTFRLRREHFRRFQIHKASLGLSGNTLNYRSFF